MKYPAYYLTVLFVLSALPACQQDRFKEDMIAFDKAFVPVYYHITLEDNYMAKRAVFRLDFQWQKFFNKYAEQFPEDENWTEGFRRANSWLQDAYTAIATNDVATAYMQLDHFRYEMIKLRARQEMPYYLDKVWDFQIALDMVMEVVRDPELCLVEWVHFEDMVAELDASWLALKHNEPEILLYNWDKEKVKIFRTKRNELGYCFEHFKEGLLCTDDRRFIANNCDEIEPKLMELIALFGDFEANQSYYARK